MSIIDDIRKDREAGTPQTWSAETTACKELPKDGYALIYDRTPGGKKNEDGSRSYSLRFPMLLASDWMAEPEKSMAEIADMLNFAERAKAALLAAEELARECERIGPVVGEALDHLGLGDKHGIATASAYRAALAAFQKALK